MRKKKDNNQWLIIGLVAAVLFYLYAQSKGGIRKVLITNKRLAEMYRELMSSNVPVFINDIPWQLDIAQMTTDYDGVKAEYLKLYNRNMTDDLLEWLSGGELSEFVAELLKNNQVMTP